MKKILLYGMLLSLLGTTACNRDNVEELKFNVSIDKGLTCQAGQPVTFHLDGNAEYITFYSGEPGNNYANIQRTEANISSMQLACTIKQQYTDLEYRNEEIVHAFISKDFSGTYTSEEIQKAHWVKISGREANANLLAVPLTINQTSEEVSSSIDLSAYKKEPFYLAFQYYADTRTDVPKADGNGRYVSQPRIDIKPLKLSKTTAEGIQIIRDNPMTEFAFRTVYENSAQQGNYQIDDISLLFQPLKDKEHTDDVVSVWMISRINPKEVEPDRGTAIKATDAYLSTYSHTYKKAGTYSATFIATNANLWDSEQIIKEVTVTVTE